MIRISDIIKMTPPAKASEDKQQHASENDSLIDRAIRGSVNSDIKVLYNEGNKILEDVFSKVRQTRTLSSAESEKFITQQIDFKAITNYINKMIDRMLLGEEGLFDYFYSYRQQQQGYLGEHSLNVCLLSMKIGIWMSMNKSELVDLGIGGLLHDVGLINIEDIISLPRKLKAKEIQAVNMHPASGAKMLSTIKGVADDVVKAVHNHHIRQNNENFLKELDTDKLQKMTQIIGLADVYEAITHSRIYKAARSPHEAIKELVEKESNNFHAKIIKSLIENIGIYPIGSWVRLTDGSIGLVISINKAFPLRPKVNIMIDAKSEKLSAIKPVDLISEPHLHIESPVDIDKNKQLIDKLK